MQSSKPNYHTIPDIAEQPNASTVGDSTASSTVEIMWLSSWTGGNYFSTYTSSLNGKITRQELANIVDVLTDSVKPLITHVRTVSCVSYTLHSVLVLALILSPLIFLYIFGFELYIKNFPDHYIFFFIVFISVLFLTLLRRCTVNTARRSKHKELLTAVNLAVDDLNIRYNEMGLTFNVSPGSLVIGNLVNQSIRTYGARFIAPSISMKIASYSSSVPSSTRDVVVSGIPVTGTTPATAANY